MTWAGIYLGIGFLIGIADAASCTENTIRRAGFPTWPERLGMAIGCYLTVVPATMALWPLFLILRRR